MTPPLFLLEHLPDGDVVLLDGEEGRHAARVRRLGIGDAVLVADGRGAVLHCTVTEVRSGSLLLSVLARGDEPAPDPRLVVVQALPKGDRGELAVELLTEIGVDEVVPWAASRCITQWRDARGDKALDKWRRVAREASKQSRRPWVPLVRDLASTADVAARLRIAAAGLVLHEDAAEPLASRSLPAAGDIVIVVGPEGGIASEEQKVFAAAGAYSVRLGSPVLRTSTAGTAALAVLSVHLDRWR